MATCGGRVPVHTLLLALHSPLLAEVLEELEEQAISLPLPLHTITRLVSIMYGERGRVDREVEEAASWLAINMNGLKVGKEEVDAVKMEELSGQSSDEGGWDFKGGVAWSKKRASPQTDFQENIVPAQKAEVSPNPKLEVNYEEFDDNFDMVEDNYDDDDYVPNNESSVDEAPKKKKRGRPRKVPNDDDSDDDTMSRKKIIKTFKCDHCDKMFSTVSIKKGHMFRKHNIDIVCDQCGDTFVDGKSYRKHMSRKDHLAVLPDPQEYICTVCGDKRTSKTALNSHIESAHGEGVSCHYCGKHFTNKAACKAHVSKKHEDGDKFQCTKCEYKTDTKGSLDRHFIRNHTEQMNQPCPHCGEIFKELKRHLDRTLCGQEGVERTMVPCPQCPKTFTNAGRMRVHIKQIHSGIRDAKCELCSYATYSNYNLKLHVTKVHHGTGLVKKQCPHCDKETTNLAHHFKLYHQLHNEPSVENGTSLD